MHNNQIFVFNKFIHLAPQQSNPMIAMPANILTPWNRIHSEKLMFIKLMKKFPAFYQNWKFITLLSHDTAYSSSYFSLAHFLWGFKTRVFYGVGLLYAQPPTYRVRILYRGLLFWGTLPVWLHWGLFSLGDPAGSYTVTGIGPSFLKSHCPLCLAIHGPS